MKLFGPRAWRVRGELRQRLVEVRLEAVVGDREDNRDPGRKGVHDNGAFCAARQIAGNVEEAASKAVDRASNALTERVRRVLALVALDPSNKEVARPLNMKRPRP